MILLYAILCGVYNPPEKRVLVHFIKVDSFLATALIVRPVI